MKVTVDLLNKSAEPVTIPLPWKLKMPEGEKQGCISRWLGLKAPSAPPQPLVVAIRVAGVPGTLTCDESRLLQVVVGDSSYYAGDCIFRVDMKTDDIPFTLLFNSVAVTDCTGTGKDMAVRVEVLVYDGKRLYGDKISRSDLSQLTPLDTIRGTVQVDIADIEIGEEDIETLLDIDVDEMTYSRNPPIIRIGELRVKSRLTKRFAPKVEPRMTYTLWASNRRRVSEALVIGEPRKEDGLLLVQDISLDMRKMKNPSNDEEEYEIECAGSYTVAGNKGGNISAQKSSLIISRNNAGATLVVKIDGNKLSANDYAAPRYLPDTLSFIMGSELQRPYSIELSNLSNDISEHGSGINVASLSIETTVRGAQLFDKNGNDISKNIVQLSGQRLPQLLSSSGLLLPDGMEDNSKAAVKLTFCPKDIADIKWEQEGLYEFSVVSELSFTYTTYNRDRTVGEPVIYRAILEQRCSVEPNPELLCVDYGTSAIVAVYDGELLDLHRQKTMLIRRDPKYRELAEEGQEEEPLFLTSDIVLHEISRRKDGEKTVSSLGTEQLAPSAYSDLAVCLSPTVRMMVSMFSYQLPCLKMLVGRELLPSNPNYNIQYYRNNANGDTEFVHATDVATDDTASLLNVMNVFRESYHTLFSRFISPAVEAIGRKGTLANLNRLVLTYPNTYTPTHLRMIREVVRSVFPAIRFDRNGLCFVSESDAVAAYYMHHWDEYHHESEDINRDENILVFDMGAGTLDVTLLVKRSSKGQHELRIEGKLGTCKAGNYLDHVIARVVCSLCRLNPLIVTTGNPQTEFSNSIAMKLAVKSQIKPRLSDESVTDIEFKMNDRTLTVSRQDILSHNLFQEYLDEATTQMLQRMCRYIGKNKLPIDTVLMSGRSLRLKPLQEQLRRAVEKISDRAGCAFIALDQPVRGNKTTNSRQKTAVAEGAIAFADMFSHPESPVKIRSKRLYANYGIAFQDYRRKWTYRELLNHKDIPIATANLEECRFPKVSINGLSTAPDIRLIQTYLNELDTMNCLNSDNQEYATVMGIYNRNNYRSELRGGDELEVGIVITEANEVSVCIGTLQSTGRTPNGTDLESEVTRRSFWPVRVTF